MFFVFIAVNGMCDKGNDCVCLPEWTGVNCQSGMNKNYPFTSQNTWNVIIYLLLQCQYFITSTQTGPVTEFMCQNCQQEHLAEIFNPFSPILLWFTARTCESVN